MATIKSYTDISQSKTLSKILPIESADMYWDLLSKDKYARVNNIGHCLCRTCVYAWSLSALLSVLPNGIVMNKDSQNGKYHFSSEYIGTYVTADNPVDACVEMIIKLKEINLL